MSYKTLLVIKAAVCLGFGALLLFLPVTLYKFFGALLTPPGVFAAREYGAAMIGIMLLTWYGREIVDSVGRRAILLLILVYDAIGAIVSIMATITGVLNPLGWSIVLLYLFLALGAAYVLRGEPQRA